LEYLPTKGIALEPEVKGETVSRKIKNVKLKAED